MSRRVLVLEQDASTRQVMARALGNLGHAVLAVGSLEEARAPLEQGQVRLALVDEAAGSGHTLDEVRRLRALYPRVPVIVTGTLLSQRVLLALMRLGAVGALLKPFSPDELGEAAAAALEQRENEDSLEYAAALLLARHALGRGRPAEARSALGRARAVAPLEADVVALAALAAELEGDDALASRGYRAALALAHEEQPAGPDPRAALARLDAFRGARPVEALDPRFHGVPWWLVADEEELGAEPPQPGPLLVVLGLGLGGDAVYLRQGAERAFALLAGGLRPEALDALEKRLGPAPRLTLASTRRMMGQEQTGAEPPPNAQGQP